MDAERRRGADGNVALCTDLSTAALDADEEALYRALRQLFPARRFRPEDDFFDDLGGHSLLAARLVSLLRDDTRYAAMSIPDVYRSRRLEGIAARMRDHRQSRQSSRASARHAVPWLRRTLCGIAQGAVIPILMILHIGDWLAPFFVYNYFTGDDSDGIPLAVLYSLATFVAAVIATLGVAVAAKWLFVGRLRPGRFPLWGATYFRYWLAGKFSQLAPLHLLSGTPLLAWVLRGMGARIGPDVLIDSLHVKAPDLLVVEAGASLGTCVYVENARVERGMLMLGEVRVGRDAVVDSYAVLEGGTALGERARLGGLSALAAGQRVPAGENWEGAPARRVHRVVEPLPPRPRMGRAARWAQVAFFAVATLAVAALFFMTIFPSFMLIDWVDAHS